MRYRHLQRALACEGRLVIALDIEKRQLREIENSYIERICADAHHLPSSNGSVDCILSLWLLEHLKDSEKCVEELYRVLRYGTAIIQLPNLQYPLEPHTKCRHYAYCQRRLLAVLVRLQLAFTHPHALSSRG